MSFGDWTEFRENAHEIQVIENQSEAGEPHLVPKKALG
jgi:hypothetical protein